MSAHVFALTAGSVTLLRRLRIALRMQGGVDNRFSTSAGRIDHERFMPRKLIARDSRCR